MGDYHVGSIRRGTGIASCPGRIDSDSNVNSLHPTSIATSKSLNGVDITLGDKTLRVILNADDLLS
jgi:hypothetical protein